MFGFLKKLGRRSARSADETTSDSSHDTEIIPTLAHAQFAGGQTRTSRPIAARPNGRCVEVPLQPVLAGLPLELQPRLLHAEVGEMTIAVPLEKILAQLSRGAVKISFGELRHAAPGVFSPAPDRDKLMVTLPLATILPQLNPALITRRRAQKQVEVPEEVFSPFESQGDGLVFSVAEPEPVPQEPAVATFRGPANVPAPMPSLRASIQSAATPQAPAAAPLVAPSLFTSARAARPTGSAPAPQPAPATAAAPAAPAPPKPAPEVAHLLAGLSALAETWPDAVRQEIVQLNLVDAKVGLPVEAVERALKQGRIAFTWKMVRSWIKPAPLPAVSANDGALLELPLKVVAPLFLARQKEVNPPQQKISIDEQIPNLFFGFPQAEASAEEAAGSHAVAKPVDTNYYVWDDTSDMARVDASEYKRRPTPGTSFISRYATPNEVVSRAAALDGVAGALIALPDGLMVASQLSPDLNGETLAAFLPQIFGKVSQCTKELRMGELNNLNFTVGNVPWKIFRVNAIFFAAFGREGEPLPTAQLAELAGELDRKQK